MKGLKLYNHVCKKYPNVKYNGEDLNLDNMYADEIKKRWDDIDRYPFVINIAYSLHISERQVYRLAKVHEMGKRPSRAKRKKKNYGKITA